MVDTDLSGEIEFSEFVAATINRDKLLTDDKLRKAFMLFDKDGSGGIDANEIRYHIGVGKSIDPEVWNGILAQVDEKGNGVIDFDEFCHMMRELLQ